MSVERAGWVRLAAGAVLVGALAWGTTVDGVLELPDRQGDDTTATSAPTSTSGAAPEALVTSADLVCPGGPDGLVVTAAVAPAQVREAAGAGAAQAGGSVVLEPGGADLGPGDPPVATKIPSSGAGVAGSLEARGAEAAGAVAAQLGWVHGGEWRGGTLAPCTEPGTEQWLLGGGGAAGSAETLVLTNPGSEAVTAEIAVWGTGGPVDLATSTVVVPAGGRVEQLLDALAPEEDSPAVRVTVASGTLAAHLLERSADGTTHLGSEAVAPAAAPADDLVLPLPPVPRAGSGDSTVTVRLVNPSDQETVVELSGLSDGGASPLEGGVAAVPAGSTLDLPLPAVADQVRAARLRSERPVTAAAVRQVEPVGDPVDDGRTVTHPAGELARTTATPLSTAPTGLTLPGGGARGGSPAALVLAAVEKTSAEVVTVDAAGRATTQTIELGFDSTVRHGLPASVRAVWVVPTGDAGVASSLSVVGSDKLGPLLASTTLPPAPWARDVVEVRPAAP